MELLAHAAGCLYGLAIGDALGMPTQELPRGRAREVLAVDGFVAAPPDQPISARLAAGSVTDDTTQAVVVAQLLIEGEGAIDPHRFAVLLMDWEDSMRRAGSLDLLGPSTRRALDAIRRGDDPDLTGTTGTTNGAAMRVAPVGIVTPSGDTTRLVDAVVAAGRPSHHTSVAHSGAAAVAAVVSAGLDGQPFREALPWALECARVAATRGQWWAAPEVAARIEWAVELTSRVAARDGLDAALDEVARLVGTSIATQESVPAAFAVASLQSDRPWSAVLSAARLGGDSDTIAAMTGAMLGAGAGRSAWPASAVETVERVNHLGLEGLAAGLVELRCPKP